MEQLSHITGNLQEAGARLTFVTTTPVPSGGLRPHRDPADVESYNAAAKEFMRGRGIEVNDLYAVVLPRMDDLWRPVNVHFTPEGSKELGAAVAGAVLGLGAG